uniref:Uncharacterized protein n=1 Tax=Meloidogyne hapla TaxID=6305 RepID=A0A1I8B6M7_MELHA
MFKKILGEHVKNHCLLLAVQLTLRYINMEKSTSENVKFQRLVNGKGARARLYRCNLIKDMLAQLKKQGIVYSPSLKHYSIEEHVPLIQKYFNTRFPGQYRLSVFGENGQMRPIYKGTDRAKKDICLYLKDGHYYGIRKLNTLFGKNLYYCLECETTYHKKKEHRQTCLAKCPRCCGMGADFPCKQIEGFELYCSKCSNIFRNPICYNRHIENAICRVFKRCKECGQIYRLKNKLVDENSNKDGHSCFIRFCSLCRSWHRREEQCFVQPIVPKQNHDYLMAMLFCSMCMRNNKWMEENTGCCRICLPATSRIQSWTGARYDNPLREFLQWLIFGLGRERTGRTYAISHYGGWVIFKVYLFFKAINQSVIALKFIRWLEHKTGLHIQH